nr:immunoglobulin heavy chain junction region [Macaca mulatta]MOX92297.1 immunoglobulin heavy chain junction region [Macaca mulatta]MOX92641.1 immunoglobulin heavy chain junction region [Macaca mulatta]MOX92795.1 immunoglobulin heavy chain junction region [Macaca mulatta]MOX95200.1 immunoglobulin heavy chain junction region [Macaca mulatta]
CARYGSDGGTYYYFDYW